MTGVEVVTHRNIDVRHLWVIFDGARPVAFCPTTDKAETVSDALAIHALLDGQTTDLHTEGPALINLVGAVWLVIHGTDVTAICTTDTNAHRVADALTLYAHPDPDEVAA